MNKTQEEIIAEKVVKDLGLKPIKWDGSETLRYNLGIYGTKTAIGTVAVIMRIAQEVEAQLIPQSNTPEIDKMDVEIL